MTGRVPWLGHEGLFAVASRRAIGLTLAAVNIRKFVVRAAKLRDLVELGSLTEQAALFLEASVVAGLNIVVAGGTQAER